MTAVFDHGTTVLDNLKEVLQLFW